MYTLRKSCQTCLTADGSNSRDDIIRVLAKTTDQELAAEMIDGWFSEPDPDGEVYGPEGPPTVEQATAMFANLRHSLDWLNDWCRN